MTDCAGKADRTQSATAIEESNDAENSVLFDQLQRYRRIVKIDRAFADCIDLLPSESVRINFEAEPQGGAGFQSIDRLMEFERAAPEGLIAESIEAKYLTPLGNE